jgi:primosomal protein N' (replication factor Y)
MVFHKLEQHLCCHHCGLNIRFPKSCPACGSIKLDPIGTGTQRLEEELKILLPDASVLRIDADSTRQKGSARAAFNSVHKGEIDILIGTQMIVKGHDFKNVTLIGALNPDASLFSHDYRASERLFAQLMQVSGRAGRDIQKIGGSTSEVLIQTYYPQHPLYEAVLSHNHNQFANSLLEERVQACLPPYIHQALLRSEAKDLESAVDFLNRALNLIDYEEIIVHDPIPMTMVRVANIDRAQLLVECTSRPKLQDFLSCWVRKLQQIKTRTKWSLEVDPIYI